MDPTSPVTADKNRGNIYKKLALINLSKINKNVIRGNLSPLNFNAKFLTQALFAQSQPLTSTKLS